MDDGENIVWNAGLEKKMASEKIFELISDLFMQIVIYPHFLFIEEIEF